MAKFSPILRAAKVMHSMFIRGSKHMLKLGQRKMIEGFSPNAMRQGLAGKAINEARKESGLLRYFVPPYNMVGLGKVANLKKIPSISRYIEQNRIPIRKSVDELKSKINLVKSNGRFNNKIVDRHIDDIHNMFTDGKITSSKFGELLGGRNLNGIK